MNNVCISIFLASILLITSCGDGAPSPDSGDCTLSIPPGEYVNMVLPDGTTIEGTAPEGGITITGLPCGSMIVQ